MDSVTIIDLFFLNKKKEQFSVNFSFIKCVFENGCLLDSVYVLPVEQQHDALCRAVERS